MPSILTKFLDSQALSFVLAAATICAFSAWLLVCLIRQAESASRASRRSWMAGTAVVAGIGVWTTHFVAMLGYRTDLVLGYHLGTTVLSAVAAIVTVGVPLAIATTLAGVWTRSVAGAAAGLGIAVMHITGMAALEGCGQTQSVGFNLLACLIGATCMALACGLPRRSNSPLITGGLIVAAVCGTHFVSIAGTVLVG